MPRNTYSHYIVYIESRRQSMHADGTPGSRQSGGGVAFRCTSCLMPQDMKTTSRRAALTLRCVRRALIIRPRQKDDPAVVWPGALHLQAATSPSPSQATPTSPTKGVLGHPAAAHPSCPPQLPYGTTSLRPHARTHARAYAHAHAHAHTLRSCPGRFGRLPVCAIYNSSTPCMMMMLPLTLCAVVRLVEQVPS